MITQESISRQLAKGPFIPHPLIENAHLQTIMASFIPRPAAFLARISEERLFNGAAGVRVLTRCSWHQDRLKRATLLLVHGLEGSSESLYMLGTAAKGFRAGFNVVRLNIRSCGGSDHLTPAIYHAGQTDDLRRVIEELEERDGVDDLYLIGFSLGGNMALKLAGELGAAVPDSLRGIVAVSPSIHLPSCIAAIELRSNLIYHLRFVRSLKNSLQRKARLFPDRYDASKLKGVWTIREFDNRYTAPHSGFRDAADYYERASSLPLLGSIRTPTLIIHAKDDPLIPFGPFEQARIETNPNITLLAPERGGHIGFLTSRNEDGDCFWAERKVIEFALWMRSKRRDLLERSEPGQAATGLTIQAPRL